MNRKKIVIICLIIAAFFVYLVASQLFGYIFDAFDVVVPSLELTRDFQLTIAHLIGLGVAGLAFVIVLVNARAMTYLQDVVVELSKVVYPTPKESAQSAVVVIVMVGIATLILAFFDWVWSGFTQMILF